MRMRSTLAMGLLVVSASCAAPVADDVSDGVTIAPRDFVLLPCGADGSNQSCALVVAGGKRVLFGGSAGTAASLPEAELRQLDSVMLFSLRARDIEGLDEIRNESWRAGREIPLLTIGPRGTRSVVDALNSACEQAGALRMVEEGIPAGGYDASILVAREAKDDQVVFDTGDVQVVRLSGGYRISYDNKATVDLLPCGDTAGNGVASTEARVSVSCHTTDGSLTWPLREPYFVVRDSAAL